ncbi:unnamed protein product [Closterium sp. NIES-54]
MASASNAYKHDKALQAAHQQQLKALLRAPGNESCADCGGRFPRFASVSLGVFLCSRCYGIHRAIGVHVTRTKCVELDAWSHREVAAMRAMGNRRAAAIWQGETGEGERWEGERWEGVKIESGRGSLCCCFVAFTSAPLVRSPLSFSSSLASCAFQPPETLLCQISSCYLFPLCSLPPPLFLSPSLPPLSSPPRSSFSCTLLHNLHHFLPISAALWSLPPLPPLVSLSAPLLSTFSHTTRAESTRHPASQGKSPHMSVNECLVVRRTSSLPAGVRAPTSASSDAEVERWIRDKYERRLFHNPAAAAAAASASAAPSPPAAAPATASPPSTTPSTPWPAFPHGPAASTAHCSPACPPQLTSTPPPTVLVPPSAVSASSTDGAAHARQGVDALSSARLRHPPPATTAGGAAHHEQHTLTAAGVPAGQMGHAAGVGSGSSSIGNVLSVSGAGSSSMDLGPTLQPCPNGSPPLAARKPPLQPARHPLAALRPAVRDHFLALDPTDLTVDLLEQHLLAAETSVVAVGATHGTPRTPFFEECSPSPLAPSYASAAAVDILGAADVRAASAPSGKRRSSKGKGGRSVRNLERG